MPSHHAHRGSSCSLGSHFTNSNLVCRVSASQRQRLRVFSHFTQVFMPKRATLGQARHLRVWSAPGLQGDQLRLETRHCSTAGAPVRERARRPLLHHLARALPCSAEGVTEWGCWYSASRRSRRRAHRPRCRGSHHPCAPLPLGTS